MPDTPQTPTPANSPAPSSPTPPSGTPIKEGELPNIVAPEYRYPENDTIPTYLRGKTAGEAAQLLQGLVEQIGRSTANAPPPQQPLTPAAEDDYVTGAHLKQAQEQALASLSPYLKSVADQQATVSYSIAKRDHADVFKSYEPEIIQVLQRVPRENWTLDVIENAVTFVKGKHVNEIVAGKVRDLETTMASTMRSTGRAGLMPDSTNRETVEASIGKLPDSWRKHAAEVGITDTEVREFCLVNDITPDEFFKQFKDGIVTDAVADMSFIRSRLG